MAAETMVRPRRVLRAGYPFLTIVFLAILAAGIDGGMVAAVVLGAAGAWVAPGRPVRRAELRLVVADAGRHLAGPAGAHRSQRRRPWPGLLRAGGA